jgi:hypothetical protein
MRVAVKPRSRKAVRRQVQGLTAIAVAEAKLGHCHVNFVWAAQSGGSPAAPIMLRVGCMSPGARF